MLRHVRVKAISVGKMGTVVKAIVVAITRVRASSQISPVVVTHLAALVHVSPMVMGKIPVPIKIKWFQTLFFIGLAHPSNVF